MFDTSWIKLQTKMSNNIIIKKVECSMLFIIKY
jgi:hypothetical protein